MEHVWGELGLSLLLAAVATLVTGTVRYAVLAWQGQRKQRARGRMEHA
jgi:hypothetical protein